MKRRPVAALLGAWLTIDLFGKARRSGEHGTSTLTPAVFTQGFLSYGFAALCWEEPTTVAFLAGTLAIVSGFTTLALLGEVHDQIGSAPDRDFVGVTPISRTAFVLARALHVTLLLGLFGLGLALGPAILGAFKLGSFVVAPTYVGIALVLAATVTGAIQLPILLASKLFGPGVSASLSAVVRAALFGGGFLAVLLGFRAMYQGPDVFPGGRAFLTLMPPYWYAKLLAGSTDTLAICIAAPLVVATGLLIVARLPDKARAAGRRRTRLRLPLGCFARNPAERGLTSFSLALLARERSFRLRALPLLGLPFAAVILGFRGGIDPDTLPFFLALVHNLPTAYLPFMLVFVPYAESWRAAWLIESTLGDPIRASRRGVMLAFAALIVPLQALVFAVDAWARDPVSAAATTLAATGLAWLVLPLLCGQLTGTAFSKDPDELTAPPEFGPPLVLAAGITVASIGIETIPEALRLALAGALAAAGLAVLRRHPARVPA